MKMLFPFQKATKRENTDTLRALLGAARAPGISVGAQRLPASRPRRLSTRLFWGSSCEPPEVPVWGWHSPLCQGAPRRARPTREPDGRPCRQGLSSVSRSRADVECGHPAAGRGTRAGRQRPQPRLPALGHRAGGNVSSSLTNRPTAMGPPGDPAQEARAVGGTCSGWGGHCCLGAPTAADLSSPETSTCTETGRALRTPCVF